MTATAILNPVKPCVKCGSTDRNCDGRCNPCQEARGAAYRAANREKIRVAEAAYYAANSGKIKARKAAYRVANPEKVRAAVAAWAAANPEAKRINKHNRKALKLAAGGKLSKGISERLFKLQTGKCACCKQPLGDVYHLDHIVPLKLGGSNTDSNIQLLRAICNMQKSAKHPVDFMQSKGFLL